VLIDADGDGQVAADQGFHDHARESLLFSDVHQTLDGADQPVTEYIRYNLANDGELPWPTRQTTAGMQAGEK
jgi:VirK protein